jgi:23S rRNA pseudouridine2605 synthase
MSKEGKKPRGGNASRGGKGPKRQGKRRRDSEPEGKDHERGERLQKILARAGLGSRRKCEEFITEGRVTVDGKRVTELGTRADPLESRIFLDGRRVRVEPFVYYVLHKPKGVISTTDEETNPRSVPGRVIDLVPPRPRVFPVGRLDVDSEGLMLLTNDGELANRMTHPRYGLERRYHATVKGEITERALGRLRRGVRLAEGKTLPPHVKVLHASHDGGVLEVTIREGLNREVRRILAAVGLRAKKLVRVGLGPLILKGIPKGASRELTSREVAALSRATAGPGSPPPKWLRRNRGNRGDGANRKRPGGRTGQRGRGD